MAEDNFTLFGTDSLGDTALQFLLDEQKKGNKRAKAVGSFLGNQMQKVFPRFKETLGEIAGGSEERRQQLNDLFGLKLGEPITSESIERTALGLGTGGIKGKIPKIFGGQPNFTTRLGKDVRPKAQIEGEEIFQPSDAKFVVDLINKNQKTFQNLGDIPGVRKGQRPPNEFLESQALNVRDQKRIQTQVDAEVKATQKDLDSLLVSEAIPGMPPNTMQEIALKGYKATATTDDNNNMLISFRSKDAELGFNDEFVIIQPQDDVGVLMLGVNFNSPTVKPDLKEIFKERFPGEFLGDSNEMDASFYQIRDFTEGMRLVNEMTNTAKLGKQITKELDKKVEDLLKTFDKILDEDPLIKSLKKIKEELKKPPDDNK